MVQEEAEDGAERAAGKDESTDGAGGSEAGVAGDPGEDILCAVARLAEDIDEPAGGWFIGTASD